MHVPSDTDKDSGDGEKLVCPLEAPSPINRGDYADGEAGLPGVPRTQPPSLNPLHIICMTLFNYAYGCICTTMGLFVLPHEAKRLFSKEEAAAAGCFMVVIGVSQLVCPYVGLVSDRCTSSMGRRRPFVLGGGIMIVVSLLMMRVTSILMWGWTFGAALLFAMLALNVVFSAQCGIVPDLVPAHQQGAASGGVALLQLLGSFTGFLIILLTDNVDIHKAYYFYIILVSVIVAIVCASSWEKRPVGLFRHPSTREVATAYIIDRKRCPDFFWVFVSRTFFYAAVGCQFYMLWYIRDVVGTEGEDKQNKQMAMISLIGQLTAALVAYPMGVYTDTARISKKVLIYFACVMMSAVYILFIMVPVAASGSGTIIHIIYGVAVLYGAGNGCYLSVDYALALDTLPSQETSGQDLGIWGIAAFIGSAVGPLLWGMLLTIAGKEPAQDGVDDSQRGYVFTGYVLLLAGGCAASFFAGYFVRYVRESQASND